MILALSHHGDLYGLAGQMADEGQEVRYFRYQVDGPTRVVGGEGREGHPNLWHCEHWRPSVADASLILADSPYFSSKAAAIPADKRTVGWAAGLDTLYQGRGDVFFRRGVPTAPGAGPTGIVWGFFNGTYWLSPFLRFGKPSREAERAGRAILYPLAELLSWLGYIGPLQAAYTVRRKAICLIDLLSEFGYGVLMKVCHDANLPVVDFLAGIEDGSISDLPQPPRRRRWWHRG